MGNFSVRVKWQVLRTRLYLEQIQAKAFILPGIVLLLSCVAVAIYCNLFQINDIWANWTAATGNAFEYCESNRMDHIIRQPANTWSNVAYFLVALFALTVGIHDSKSADRRQSKNFLVRYPMFSIMFGLSVLYVFIGSFLFHASLTHTFQHLDQAGMYAVVSIILCFNLYKLFPIIRIKGRYKSSHVVMILVALVLNYFAFTKLCDFNINVYFPMFAAGVFLSSLCYILFVSKHHYFTNYLWASFIALLLATVVWLLDRTNIACNPTSIIQGHALWHILGAISMLFIYLYYRTGSVPVDDLILRREERRGRRGK